MDAVDVVVIGGGAAGLSAALVLGRARRRVVVIDAGHPRNAPAAHMHGYLSRDGESPAALLAAGREELARYGVEVVAGEVASLAPGFTVSLADGRVNWARRVLVATGVRDVLPPIDGIARRWGRDLLHCPYCHGWEVRGRRLGVIGSAPGSVQYAQIVRQWTRDVVFFENTCALSGAQRAELTARGIPVVHGAVAELVVTDDALTGVRLASGEVVSRDAVFVRPVNRPHDDSLLAGVGCDLDEAGFPVTDGTGLTTVPGVWVAGNAADPRAQVITAAGAGSAAAIAMNADLVREDVEASLAAARS